MQRNGKDWVEVSSSDAYRRVLADDREAIPVFAAGSIVEPPDAEVLDPGSSVEGRSDVIVVRDDPYAWIGVMLASRKQRRLRVLSRSELLSAGAHPHTFTLVVSGELISPELVREICASDIPSSFLTGPSVAAASRLAARAFTVEPPAAALAVLDGVREPRPFEQTLPSLRVLANAPAEQLRDTLYEARSGALSLLHHGRDFCGRFAGAALCCQTELEQSEGRCVDGMQCFDPSWVRIAPRRLSARMLFSNSCSAFKPQGAYFGIPSSVGTELLAADVAGLIACTEVGATNGSDNVLFHALVEAGFTLAEIALLLRRAAGGARDLVAVGDAELALSARSVVPSASVSRDLRVDLPADGPLHSVSDPRLRRAAEEEGFLLIDEEDDATFGVSRIVPGLLPDEVLVLSRSRALRVIARDDSEIGALERDIDLLEQRLAALETYLLTDTPFPALREDLASLRRGLASLAAPKGWWAVSRRDLSKARALLDETTRRMDAAVSDAVGVVHCIETVNVDLLSRTGDHYADSCPYCDERVRTTISKAERGPPLRLETKQCPRCALLAHGSGEVSIEITCDDRIGPGDIGVAVELRSKIDRSISGWLTLIGIPSIPGLEGIECPGRQAFGLPAGGRLAIPIVIKVPRGAPANVHILQATVIHDLAIDAARRPVRIGKEEVER